MGQRSPVKATWSGRWDFSCLGKLGSALPGILGEEFSRQRKQQAKFQAQGLF